VKSYLVRYDEAIKKATSFEVAFDIYWRTGRDTNSLTILSYSFFNSQSTSHIWREIKNYLSYTVSYSITEYFRYIVPKIVPKIVLKIDVPSC
jgi:hypothetical protein